MADNEERNAITSLLKADIQHWILQGVQTYKSQMEKIVSTLHPFKDNQLKEYHSNQLKIIVDAMDSFFNDIRLLIQSTRVDRCYQKSKEEMEITINKQFVHIHMSKYEDEIQNLLAKVKGFTKKAEMQYDSEMENLLEGITREEIKLEHKKYRKIAVKFFIEKLNENNIESFEFWKAELKHRLEENFEDIVVSRFPDDEPKAPEATVAFSKGQQGAPASVVNNDLTTRTSITERDPNLGHGRSHGNSCDPNCDQGCLYGNSQDQNHDQGSSNSNSRDPNHDQGRGNSYRQDPNYAQSRGNGNSRDPNNDQDRGYGNIQDPNHDQGRGNSYSRDTNNAKGRSYGNNQDPIRDQVRGHGDSRDPFLENDLKKLEINEPKEVNPPAESNEVRLEKIFGEALALASQGKFDPSIQKCQIAQLKFENKLGSSHKLILRCKFHVADVFRYHNDLDGTIKIYHEILQSERDILAQSGCTRIFVEMLNQKKTYSNIILICVRALDIQNSVLDTDDRGLIMSITWVADRLCDERHFDEAIRFYIEALDRQEKVKNSTPQLTQSIIKNKSSLAYAWYMQGSYTKAIQHYQQILEVQELRLGSQNVEVLSIKKMIAHSYYGLRIFPDAASIFFQVLGFQEYILGIHHQETLDTRMHFAAARVRSGAVPEGLQILEHVLFCQIRTLGQNHQAVLRTKEHIASAKSRYLPNYLQNKQPGMAQRFN